MFENTITPGKRYAFIENEDSSDIIGILYNNDKESIRIFKNEKEIKRKRSALISSGEWKYVTEFDRDTGIKLPLYMYPPYDTQIRWTVQWMENENHTENGGLKKTIMSSFIKLDAKEEEPRIRYYRNLTEVKEQYDLLKSHGWIEAKQPKIDIKYASPEDAETKTKRQKEEALQALLMI